MKNTQNIINEQQEEAELLAALEAGTLNSVPNVDKEIKRTVKIFKANGKKTKRMNIRMTEWDYEEVLARAMREGLAPQSLLSSVLHKWLTGQLVSMQSK